MYVYLIYIYMYIYTYIHTYMCIYMCIYIYIHALHTNLYVSRPKIHIMLKAIV